MVDLGHQGVALLFLKLAGGDVLDNADDPLDLALGVADPLSDDAKPDHRLVRAGRDAAFHLVAVGGLEAFQHLAQGLFEIVGVDKRQEGAAAVGGKIAGRPAGDGRHAVADDAEIARDIILELPQTRGLERQFEMLHVQARAPRVIDHDQSLTPAAQRCDKNRAEPAKI